jgi:DNA repair photolyase
MNRPEMRLRRAFVARDAVREAVGRAVMERLQAAGVPVEMVSSDEEVRCHPAARAAGSVLVLCEPEMGWISAAEHGTLAVRPGERYLNPIAGCRSSCTYCFLRASGTGLQPLRLHVGIDSLFTAIERDARSPDGSPKLYCTGELADSLGDADIFPVAALLAAFFSTRTDARLELRTKSDRVEQLLTIPHGGRTTVAFTLSPQQQIDRFEPGTATLAARVRAANRCQAAGYPIAFKLEPVLLLDGWREAYRAMLDAVAAELDMGAVEHASVGCLRWSEALGTLPAFAKSHGEALDGGTWIEYRPGSRNGTLARETRLDVYRWMKDELQSRGFGGMLWWSLEEPELVQTLSAR